MQVRYRLPHSTVNVTGSAKLKSRETYLWFIRFNFQRLGSAEYILGFAPRPWEYFWTVKHELPLGAAVSYGQPCFLQLWNQSFNFN